MTKSACLWAVVLSAAVGCSSGGHSSPDAATSAESGSTLGDAASCSGPQATQGSCVVVGDAGTSFCVQYTGPSYTSDMIQQLCTAIEGTPSSSGCPADTRVGGCIVDCGKPLEAIKYYYLQGPFKTSPEVKQVCMLDGETFIP